MSEQLYKIDILYGVKELETRLRTDGSGRIIGEGRSRVVDRAGFPGPWSAWEPAGVALVYEDETPKRPWWKLW